MTENPSNGATEERQMPEIPWLIRQFRDTENYRSVLAQELEESCQVGETFSRYPVNVGQRSGPRPTFPGHDSYQHRIERGKNNALG